MKMIKKVLLVATVQSHIAQFHKPLMRLLKDYGWVIHVAARNNLEEKNGLQLEYPDKVFDIPFQRSPFDKRNINAYRTLCDVLEKEHYDVIHCNTPVGGILGRIAARKLRKNGTRVFYTAHGFHFYKGAPIVNWIIYYPIEKWASYFTDKLITITDEDYKLAQRKFHCPVYHIHGVGANSSKYYPIPFKEQLKKKNKLGVDGPIVINVGELLPNKNQKTAIMAMKYVHREFPEAKLFIAGNGPEKKALEYLVKKLDLEDVIYFLGYTTELQNYMQICDVEIACSYREGLPLNIIEAMMCGKPVVASYNRGHNELIVDGINGYLVQADNTKMFADKICYFLKTSVRHTEDIIEQIKLYKDISVEKELMEIYQL